MSDMLKPLFFIVRDNGVITPLIAIDELPHHIRIDGVARTMILEETMGMTNVGKFPARHQQYKIINLNEKSKHISSLPRNSSSSSFTVSEYTVDDDNTSFPPPSTTTTDVARKIDNGRVGNTSITSRNTNNPFSKPKRSYGIREQDPKLIEDTHNIITQATSNLSLIKADLHSTPDHPAEAFRAAEPLPAWKDKAALGTRLPPPGKKVYCSHWMSTGECDFAQQGCMYKHEMPLDIGLLNILGYQDIPKWYRERYGIGRLTAIPGSGAHVDGPVKFTKQRQGTQSGWTSVDNTKRGGRRGGNNQAYPQVANAPFRHSSKITNRKNGNGNNGSQSSNRDYQNLPASDTVSNNHSNAGGKSKANSTVGLLNSRFAPLQPTSPHKTGRSSSDRSGTNTSPASSKDSGDTAGGVRTNVISNTTVPAQKTVIAQPRPLRFVNPHAADTGRGNKTNTTISSSNVRSVAHAIRGRGGMAPLRGSAETDLVRRGSELSQVSAFSDYEANVFELSQHRRISEEEEYLQACNSKAKEDQEQQAQQLQLQQQISSDRETVTSRANH